MLRLILNYFFKALSFALFISVTAVHAQMPTSEKPLRIVENEGDVCKGPVNRYSVSWTFDRQVGQGLFATGDQQVTLEHFDADSITVRRLDTVGNSAGLKALYKGKIVGNTISGMVEYHPPGRRGLRASGGKASQTGIWCGLIDTRFGELPKLAKVMPSVMMER